MKHTGHVPSFLARPSLRLLLFGGKGGVGKTTCAAAAALRMAAHSPEQSFLLVSTDPAHSLQDCFAGFEPPANLKVLELDTEALLKMFRERHLQTLKEIALRGTFLDEEDINRFMELSLPGMDELFGFLEISAWIREHAYDGIIVDMAPTGHTLHLLAMPEFIRKWIEAQDVLLAKHRYMKKIFHGSYQRDELDSFIEGMALSVQQMNDLFMDHRQCCFIPVMIAEALSIEETMDLISSLQRLKMDIRDIVVNRLYPDSTCPVCSEGRSRQTRELANLFGIGKLAGYRFWGAPLYPKEVLGGGLQGFWKGAWELTTASLTFMDRSLEQGVTVESPAEMPSEETSLIIFAGKGGVGKTTLASATALHLAKSIHGKEILLFSADPAHSLSDCLNMKIGPDPIRVAPGLSAMEVDAQAEFDSLNKEYQKELKHFLSAALPNLDLTFDREVMERILSLSPPGLDEIMALTLVMDLLSRGRYDLLVLDAAPTGHLLRLLELPEIIDTWLKAFFRLFLKYKQVFHLPKISQRLIKMSKDLKGMRSILHDPGKSALYGVSILTEMAFAETKDLVSKCTELGIAMPVLFLNLATPDSDCPLCSQISEREDRLRDIYRQTFPRIHQTLVYRGGESRGIQSLEGLGDRLYGDGLDRPQMEQNQKPVTASNFFAREMRTGA